MKVLLEIKDSKAHHLMEVLKDLPYVKATTLTLGKANALENVLESVEEMKLINQGKLEARNAEDLFDEL